MSNKKPLYTTAKAWTIFLVQLNEAYQITVLLPMVVFMVRDFGISPQNLGIFTSILNAAFCGCQFPVSYLWGYLSDIFGRRKTLLASLIFSTIALLAFGVSQTYTQALIARCVQGLFFGNLGILKAYLADITDSTNRAQAFTMIIFSFGFGVIIGSMLGGIMIITTDPDASDEDYIKTESIIGIEPFKTKIPFFPPILVGAIFAISGIIMTILHVHDEKLESNIVLAYQNDDETDYNDDDRVKKTSYSLPMITDTNDKNGYSNGSKKASEAQYFSLDMAIMGFSQANPGQSQHYTMSFPSDALNKSKDKEPLIDKKNGHSTIKPKQSSDITGYNNPDIHGIRDLLTKTPLIFGLIAYGGNAISHMMYQEMNPVFMAQSLDYSSQFIGYRMAWSGVLLCIWTYFIQPKILKRFPNRELIIILQFSLAILMVLTPMVYYLSLSPFNWNNIVIFVPMLMLEALVTCGSALAFTISVCYVNNLVPNEHVGKANGVGQTIASFNRAIGPTITGFIWSDLSYPYFEKYSYAIFYAYAPAAFIWILCAITAIFRIKPEYQLSWQDRQQKLIKNNKKRSKIISMQKMSQ